MSAYSEAVENARERAEELRSDIIDAYSTSTHWRGLEEEMLERGWEVADMDSIWTQENWELVTSTRSQNFDLFHESFESAGGCFDSMDNQIACISYYIREALLLGELRGMFATAIVMGD
jgi:hypothetical protein